MKIKKGKFMVYKITHIRLSNPSEVSTKKITHIKLESGVVETAAMAAYFIDMGCKYTYTNSAGKEIFVTSVHPIFGNPYIETLDRTTEFDELLNLPYF
ncbi:hypothetical protein KF201_1260 [Lactococcus lactis subsp. lactis]|nr:hypothetical protein KF201_1260 [Lactococcus lactis subsp. lactis]